MSVVKSKIQKEEQLHKIIINVNALEGNDTEQKIRRRGFLIFIHFTPSNMHMFIYVYVYVYVHVWDLYLYVYAQVLCLTIFKMGGGKRLPASFFYIIFTNVGIILKNWGTPSLNHFTIQCKISKPSQCRNLNQDGLLKNLIFWSNVYKTEVITTSLIEMLLQFPKFDDMTISTI